MNGNNKSNNKRNNKSSEGKDKQKCYYKVTMKRVY